MEPEVAGVTGFFGTPYASAEGTKPSIPDVDTMSPMQATGMVGGNTLDEIIMQNSKEMERRRSVQEQLFVTDTTEQVGGLRRGSMIEFDNAGSGELNGFHFSPSTTHGRERGVLREAATGREGDAQRQPMGTINLSSHYANLGVNFATMAPSTPFQPRLHIQNLMNLNVPHPYIASTSAPVPSNAMLMDFEPDNAGHSAGDLTPMDLFARRSLHQSPQDALTSPMHQPFGSHNGQERDRRDRGIGNASGLLGELSSPDTLSEVTVMSVAERVQGMQSTIPLADMSAQEPGSAISMRDPVPGLHEAMEGQTENVIIPAPTIGNSPLPELACY
jgi:hypothetical protein